MIKWILVYAISTTGFTITIPNDPVEYPGFVFCQMEINKRKRERVLMIGEIIYYYCIPIGKEGKYLQ